MNQGKLEVVKQEMARVNTDILGISELKWPSVQFSSVTQSCLTLCDPMNSIKKQKDMTLKDEFSRSVGAQYATREEWRNSSRKKEEAGPKWKQHAVLDVSGGESKVQCYK